MYIQSNGMAALDVTVKQGLEERLQGIIAGLPN